MAALNTRMTGSQAGNDPAVGAIAIDYSGGNQVLDPSGRAVYIATAGNLNVVMQDGSTVLFSNLVAGQIYAIAIKQVTQTNSTAAGLVLR